MALLAVVKRIVVGHALPSDEISSVNAAMVTHFLSYNKFMTTLIHQPVPFVPAPSSPPREQHLVLHNVTWNEYVTIGRLLADRPALRITYDRGTLEFMSTSPRHERYKHYLGRFLETVAEELDKPIMPGGSMTFQREDLARGFEPDNCYWIANEAAVRAKLTWEPDIDPPPYVGIEIEVSRSVLGRMSIFAAFRVPEVWYYDGQELRINLLQPDGTYQLSDRSLAFPSIPVQELVRFFPTVDKTDYLSAVKAVRAWVRSYINKPE
jgi:Uma2 family endonuclease